MVQCINKPMHFKMELFIRAWILQLMDSYSSMSMTNLLSNHLVGEYLNGESYLSDLMANQTMAVMLGPDTNSSPVYFSAEKNREKLAGLCSLLLFSRTQ